MADPTMSFLRRLDDRSLWHVVENVPIFSPHERPGVTVTERDLNDIVANANRNRSQYGVVPKVTIGHRRLEKDAREQDQPESVGYIPSMRVGRFGPGGQLGILADLYIRLDRVDTARGYDC